MLLFLANDKPKCMFCINETPLQKKQQQKNTTTTQNNLILIYNDFLLGTQVDFTVSLYCHNITTQIATISLPILSVCDK